MALASILLFFTYPLLPTQVSLVTMFTIGIPSFFLAQIPNEDLIKGNFIKNVIYNAAPPALTGFAMLLITTILGSRVLSIDKSNLSTVCTYVWATVGLIYLIKLCRPFDKWKGAITGFCIVGFIMLSTVFRSLGEKLFGMNLNLNINAIALLIGTVAVSPLMMLLMEKFFKWLMDTFLENLIQTRIKKLPNIFNRFNKKTS